MDSVTEEKRILAYRALPHELKDLYGSEELEEKIAVQYMQYAQAFPRKQFSDTIGDAVLGFYPVSDITAKLMSDLRLPENQARTITSELLEVLEPVVRMRMRITPPPGLGSEGNAQQNEHRGEQRTEVPPPPNESAVHQAAGEQGTVPPVRTMAGDMDTVRGYGSYQKMFSRNKTDDTNSDPVITSTSQEDLLKKIDVPS